MRTMRCISITIWVVATAWTGASCASISESGTTDERIDFATTTTPRGPYGTYVGLAQGLGLEVMSEVDASMRAEALCLPAVSELAIESADDDVIVMAYCPELAADR